MIVKAAVLLSYLDFGTSLYGLANSPGDVRAFEIFVDYKSLQIRSPSDVIH